MHVSVCRKGEVKKQWGTLARGSPRPNRPPDGLASPPELLGILKISPIAMGVEGLRPSTPQAFVKACAKLLSLSAGKSRPFQRKRKARCARRRREKVDETFTFRRGACFFSRKLRARRTRRRRATCPASGRALLPKQFLDLIKKAFTFLVILFFRLLIKFPQDFFLAGG